MTYDRENPGLGRLPADIVTIGMNKEDAASLLASSCSRSRACSGTCSVRCWTMDARDCAARGAAFWRVSRREIKT